MTIIILCRWPKSERILGINECGKALASAEMHLLLDLVKVTPLVWSPERKDYLKAVLGTFF